MRNIDWPPYFADEKEVGRILRLDLLWIIFPIAKTTRPQIVGYHWFTCMSVAADSSVAQQ